MSSFTTITSWFAKIPRNTTDSITRLTPYGWLRLVLIVTTYLLIRPYLMRLAERSQTAAHEKAVKESAMGPNVLRGHSKGTEDIGGEDSKMSSCNWGPKARKRQKQSVDKVVEDEIRKAEDEDEDKDVEFLKKYCT
ncbi:MAG: hypothetical protein Q9166_003576 [cf. Caloplaca sp. 2 TL-2023]